MLRTRRGRFRSLGFREWKRHGICNSSEEYIGTIMDSHSLLTAASKFRPGSYVKNAIRVL